MKVYTGNKTNVGPNDIYIIEGNTKYILDPSTSQKVYNHSPDGFNWGYSGSGPAQAALAILLDCLDKNLAVLLYQKFKFNFVAGWNDKFSISEEDIKNWINDYYNE